MIITELYAEQGLGNQLWVYAACRSIAEQLNYPFAVLGQRNFKGRQFLNLDFASSNVLGEALASGGLSGSHGMPPTIFHERLFYDPDLRYIASDFDESVMALGAYTRLEGLFQSERYFFGDTSRTRSYIRIKDDWLASVSVSEDVCVLNVRGGEYKRHKRLILPPTYWLNAMGNMKAMTGIDNFLIVTDDPRYAASLLPDIPVLQGGIAECYIALHEAKNVIVSNSSFSYFPIKTGREDRVVIAPKHWARFGNRCSRWASPANLYESWMWQDVGGSLHSYADCLPEQEQTSAYYRDSYYLCTVPSAVSNPGIRGHFPNWLKNPIKKGLSWFFPRHIG